MVQVILFLNVQHNYLEGNNPIPDASFVSDKIEKLITKARSAANPPLFVWVRNCGEIGDPDQPNTYGWELHYPVQPQDHVVDKYKNNAFDQDKLEPFIPTDADLFVVGMQSEYDLRSACFTALERGNTVHLVRYAHGTFHTETKRASRIQRDIEVELEKKGVLIIDLEQVPFPPPIDDDSGTCTVTPVPETIP